MSVPSGMWSPCISQAPIGIRIVSSVSRNARMSGGARSSSCLEWNCPLSLALATGNPLLVVYGSETQELAGHRRRCGQERRPASLGEEHWEEDQGSDLT